MDRFEVQKRTDDYGIWDKQQLRWYCTGGIVLHGSEAEMKNAAADLNRMQMMKEKLQKVDRK